MNLFKLFKRANTTKGTGALDDTRTNFEKEKDYKAEELVAFSGINWVEKDWDEFRKYPITDQGSSSSCVAHTLAKLLGIENEIEEGKFIQFSPRDIYSRRTNKPGGGMYANDAGQIAQDYGATLESLMPSSGKGEIEMNKESDRLPSYEQIGKIFKAKSYIWLPPDIDKIAEIINSGKGVMIWFKFEFDEWKREVPKILREKGDYHHSVAGVDTTLYKGKKTIVIDDSWGTENGRNGQRIVTEDWINKRNTVAIYLEDLSNVRHPKEKSNKPVHTFTRPLEFSTKYFTDSDVVALQNILKYEGLFPKDIESTGYYGAITAIGVYKFQEKYNVASEQELDSLQGKRVGSKTIDTLNNLYGK